MKVFNKNRKSFGNNKFRGNDRNSKFRGNDRNNKFRKNDRSNKHIKSEPFHEGEDATPWHLMKQNIKKSVSMINPEIEDDWNTEEKQNAKAAKQEFMRQKEERYRKFVIENERKAETKWDNFSDVEQSDGAEQSEIKSSDESDDATQLVVPRVEEKVGQIIEKGFAKSNTNTSKYLSEEPVNPSPVPVQTSLKKHASNKKLKKSKNESSTSHASDESVQVVDSVPAPAKRKKNKSSIEPSVGSSVPTETNSKKGKKKNSSIEPVVLSSASVETSSKKKGSKNKLESNGNESSPKKAKKNAIEEHSRESSVIDKVPSPKRQNTTKEVPQETFLENLAIQQRNEPLLESSELPMKTGPKCFVCRQYGHSLKQCREFDNNSTRICIKCGSNEHSYQNCTIHKGRVFKFASCFICKQTGHISSQCRDKKNGVYPDGGNCRYCSSIDHLGLNCPRRPGRKKRKFSKNRNSSQNKGNNDKKFGKVQQNGSGRVDKPKGKFRK